MSWSQVSENRWERPANGMEGFFIFMGNISASLFEGRRQFTICSRLKVDLQIPAAEVEDALRYAWKQLRYEQPQIAVTVEGFNHIYEVPDEAALQSWLDKTFVVSDDTDGEAVANEAVPFEQTTFYYVPKASQLVIRASHSTVDGMGMVLLWHAYLTALTNPKPNLVFGGEAARLPPSVEKVLGLPDVPQAEVAAKAEQMVLDTCSSMPGIGPLNRVGTVPAGRTQRREIVLPERTTDAITQACKKNGYSVTAAAHAAFTLATVKHADTAPTAEKSKYVTVNSFNFRPKLPEPYNSSQYAAAVFYAIWPLILEKPENFKDVVRVINEHYKSTFNGNAENVALTGPIAQALREFTQTPAFLTAPPSRDALVSSLGVIERHLQQSYASTDNTKRVIIEDFKLGIETILGHSMFNVFTFRNQMRLVFSFNEAYEDESHIQSYLEDIQKILLEELVA
ncbi:hypothetical protein N7451_002828 [Penicillium sp. IBT 35674x]|nr:hypothetical protein N7451_002828 [Penicillium sp. IBT 35674x]